MANELDKSIEELEAEVIAELEEGAHDAPTKGAMKSEPMPKKPADGATGEEDIGGSTPSKVTPPTGKSASKSSKEVGGDAQQKGEGKPDKMQKYKGKDDGTASSSDTKPLAMGYTDDEIRELCHSKNHDCATVVEHPEFGKGKPIVNSHAIPDDEGNVEWYDVQFKHGIEEKVMASDMKIIEESHHEEEMPKTKNGMINAMKDMMAGMHKEKKDMIMATYKAMKASYEGMHEKDEETAEEKEKKEAVEKRVKDINVKEHVDALMNGEGDLSEEFKRKAATVFEAAVKSKVREEVERLEEDYRKDLDENMVKTQEELTEKVDNYLNYVVEEWTKENELAIERGLKGEIAEDFISGLKQLFEDHYIDVPDEKYDVLEAQSQKISELEAKLNEEMEKNVSFKNNNAKLVREQVISQCTGDLTEVEIEKFKSLTEDVDFTDEDSFRSKLDTLKESYFPKNKPNVTETTDDVETGNAQDIDTSGSMAVYMKAIGKGVKSAK